MGFLPRDDCFRLTDIRRFANDIDVRAGFDDGLEPNSHEFITTLDDHGNGSMSLFPYRHMSVFLREM